MPRFRVELTRLAIVFREEIIDAVDEQSAETQALSRIKAAGNDGNWSIDDLYNDGKPHCALTVNAVHPVIE